MIALLLVRSTGSALGAPANEGIPPAPTEDAAARARRDAQDGKVRYELGEYAEAIAAFKKAYALEPDPALLFNIAQAYRLQGDCAGASESYRHFLRLAPRSPARPQAEKHLEALRASCGADEPEARAPVLPPLAPSPPASPALVIETAPPTPVATEGSSGRGRTWAFVTLGAGALAGATAGAFLLRNNSRFATWQSEDEILRSSVNGDPGGAEMWGQRQEENDERLGSIRREDRVAWILSAAAVTLVVTGAMLLFGSRSSSPAAGAPTEK